VVQRDERSFDAAHVAPDDPHAQSGFGGDESRWEAGRRPIVKAIDCDGTFLDVGCANGYLMECVAGWAPHHIEPYGLECAQGEHVAALLVDAEHPWRADEAAALKVAEARMGCRRPWPGRAPDGLARTGNALGHPAARQPGLGVHS
jgi:hypothetical protein